MTHITGHDRDLFLQLPELPTLILEVKYAPAPRPRGFAKAGLTPLQSQFVRQVQAAGGYAGWVLVIRDGSRHTLIAGWNPKGLIPGDGVLRFVRERGKAWPIREIATGIIRAIDVWRIDQEFSEAA